MQKPRKYDETVVGGNYTPPEVGGHHLVIHQVEERKNKNDGDMIVVSFDFAPNDRQAMLFAEQYKKDQRQERKWPRSATSYINVYKQDGDCSKPFKSFCTAWETSTGKTVQWGDGAWGSQFRGTRIGGVFGLVENEWKGKKTMRPELRWFCDDAKATEQNVPDPVYLDPDQQEKFMNIPDGVGDEGLPWNQ